MIKDIFNYLPEIIRNSPDSRFQIQSIRFIIAGSFTASIDMIILLTLHNYFEINYLVAAAIGFIVGSSLNYFISIRWVFYQGRHKNIFVEYFLFFLISSIALMLNQLIVYLSVEEMKLTVLLSKINSIIIVTVFNYASKKFIVFKG